MIMTIIQAYHLKQWQPHLLDAEKKAMVEGLESGKVIYFPQLDFVLEGQEKRFLHSGLLNSKAKNISYDCKTNILKGASLSEHDELQLKSMLRRYSVQTRLLMELAFPEYKGALIQGKTSFRPVEILGRKTSYRKNDTRLHVDAFPSNPTQGERILRFFTNINHEGKPRVWRLGEPLEDVLNQFLPKVSNPLRGKSTLLKYLKITKKYRTRYDHYMLGVHDLMKKDLSYQASCNQEIFDFPPASSWIVYTDQVSHAAMSGQHVLEQTFHIPIKGMVNHSNSPLRLMERLLKSELI